MGDVGGESCSDDAVGEGCRSRNDGTRAPRMADSRGVVGLLAHRQGDERLRVLSAKMCNDCQWFGGMTCGLVA